MALRFKGVHNLPFAPVAAAIFGLGAAAFVFAIPVYYVERMAEVSGLASVLPAARAPLGNTAQGLIALAMAFGTFVVMWLILRPVEKLFKRRKAERKERSFRFGRKQPGSMPDADDVPLTAAETVSARKPIFAQAELGAPLMSDAALVSGGELLAGAPAARTSIFDEAQPLDLTAMMAEPASAPELTPSPAVEPQSVVTAPEPLMAPIEWLTPDQVPSDGSLEREASMPVSAESAPAAAIVPPIEEAADEPTEEPSLRELLVRFETALKKRRDMEAAAQQSASPFPDAALSSLRNLMAANRVR